MFTPTHDQGRCYSSYMFTPTQSRQVLFQLHQMLKEDNKSKQSYIVCFFQAAAHIHRFLSLDENVLRMSADANEGKVLVM